MCRKCHALPETCPEAASSTRSMNGEGISVPARNDRRRQCTVIPSRSTKDHPIARKTHCPSLPHSERALWDPQTETEAHRLMTNWLRREHWAHLGRTATCLRHLSWMEKWPLPPTHCHRVSCPAAALLSLPRRPSAPSSDRLRWHPTGLDSRSLPLTSRDQSVGREPRASTSRRDRPLLIASRRSLWVMRLFTPQSV
jgi:hypothetical protein